MHYSIILPVVPITVENFGHFSAFCLRCLLGFPDVLRRPSVFAVQLYRILQGGLPLCGTAGIAMGLVVWMHLREALRSVGGPSAVQALPQALSLAVVMEFAPITAGLLMAGRTGASLGAELGAMKLSEQIDALEVLGKSVMKELVVPRVLACMVALPLLCLIIAYLAMGTGFIAELLGGTIGLRQYVNECLRNLVLREAIPANLKTIAFGFLIGVIGCWNGLNTQGGTEGVGNAATRAVVSSIFAVLISNVVLVRVIQFLTA